MKTETLRRGDEYRVFSVEELSDGFLASVVHGDRFASFVRYGEAHPKREDAEAAVETRKQEALKEGFEKYDGPATLGSIRPSRMVWHEIRREYIDVPAPAPSLFRRLRLLVSAKIGTKLGPSKT